MKNPYDHEVIGYGHPCPHCVWENGARAVIAEVRKHAVAGGGLRSLAYEADRLTNLLEKKDG